MEVLLALDALKTPAAQNDVRFYIPFARIDEEQHMVWGIGVSTAPPSSGKEPISWAAIKDAMPEYLEWRNVREMHEPSAVGTAEEVSLNDAAQQVEMGIKVSDHQAWEKVTSGTYKGISVGGKKRLVEDGTITAMDITEFSLVDRPDITDCKFTLWRRAPEGGKGDKMDNGIQKLIEDLKGEVERVKVAGGEDINYSLFFAQDAIGLMSNIKFLYENAVIEAAKTGDVTVADVLKQMLTMAGQVAVTAVQSEAALATGEAAPAPVATEAALAAAMESGDIRRKAAKLSKASFAAIADAHRIISAIIGVKAMTNEQMTEARAAFEKEEADAATAAANDEAAAAAGATEEDKKAAADAEAKKKADEEAAAAAVASAADSGDVKRAVDAAVKPYLARIEAL